MEWFVNTFENKKLQQYRKAYEWSNRSSDDRETLENDIELLFDAGELVSIESNMDWREAIKMAANKFRLKKVAEALPEAYEQYLMNIQLGIGFPVSDHWEMETEQLIDIYKKTIFVGRKINGEPEDLNF
jgi:hypothetical protein